MICAEDNGIWDAAINMGFRMALSNYKPRQPPKYEYPEDVCDMPATGSTSCVEC